MRTLLLTWTGGVQAYEINTEFLVTIKQSVVNDDDGF
jgi:hypothetical protein